MFLETKNHELRSKEKKNLTNPILSFLLTVNICKQFLLSDESFMQSLQTAEKQNIY